MEGAIIDYGLLAIMMKKLVLGLLILMMLATTNAYTSSTVTSGSRFVSSSTDHAIFSMDEELKIVIELEEVITRSFEVKDGVKTKTGTSRKVSYEGLSHNLEITNNASDVIESVIVENPFDEVHIGKLGMIKSGQSRKIPVEIFFENSNGKLKKLIGTKDEQEILFRIQSEDRSALLREMVILKVNTTTIEKERVTHIAPDPVDEASASPDSASATSEESD